MSAKKVFGMVIVTLTILAALACGASPARKRSSVYPLTFKGPASGGVLVVGTLLNLPGVNFIEIETSPGESAESVVHRLEAKIKAVQAVNDMSDRRLLWIGAPPVTSGATIELAGTMYTYFLAGTETGLGIPQPPVFLTCLYNQAEDSIKLVWENPLGGYDKIFLTLRWNSDWGRRSFQKVIQGDSTSFVIDRTSSPIALNVQDLDIAIVGFRNGIVSSPGAIHMKGHYQDEAFAIPFARDIMPNWSAWRTSAMGKSVEPALRANTASGHTPLFSCGKRIAFEDYQAGDGLDAKPFYQIIKASPSGRVGIYRKFLGLIPGHTYRITAALSTLEMHASESEWSLDICAAHNESGRKKLTPEQLAGEAALPNQKWRRDRPSGRFAIFGKNRKTTGPGFRLVKSRSKKHEREKEGVDITLPPGVDTLTVWLRFNCSDPDGSVGFMGVGIEDITASQSQGLKSGDTLLISPSH